jgi:hypothetical protein
MDACEKNRWGWALLSLLLFLGSGCHSTQPLPDEFAKAPVHQVHVTWSDKIVVTTDCGHDRGADLPGIVGRLYLMGADLGHTVRSDGRVVVDLYDASQAKFLGRWQISKENMAKFGQKDRIGLGYTLFLPLPPDFKVDSNKFQLQVSYLPDDGPAMFAARSTLTINKDEFKALATTIRAQPIGQEQPQVTLAADPGARPASPNRRPLLTLQETN